MAEGQALTCGASGEIESRPSGLLCGEAGWCSGDSGWGRE